ncbi:hypothetical protein [Phyllobacterium zundukense]|uniref:Uncharacterized protein n=1 Tax=Phyllobacterium zundukense TaxID=1867719 RepID=A0ACD4CXB7_9HYPH|nr:hypothetical protein [Phyllobacterium zundukense]UXN58142.1 hypothetical protein N8E88_04780 [Phyllobacterium zundukense]
MKLTRAVLYELVWSYPITQIAKHYGVRDLQIAKACDLYDIARPPAGYWQKLAYGKNVEKAALQTVNFSAEKIVAIERSGTWAPCRAPAMLATPSAPGAIRWSAPPGTGRR